MGEAQPTPEDFQAADAVIDRQPALDEDARAARRLLLAQFRARVGPDSFALMMGLRQPRNDTEAIGLARFRGEITVEEYQAKRRAETERDIDLPMLKTFFQELEDRIGYYSDVLQEIAAWKEAVARGERTDQVVEAKVAKHIRNTEQRSSLFSEQLERIDQFIAEVRADKNLGLAVAADEQGHTASILIRSVIRLCGEYWKSASELAARSESDPRYIRSATAPELFERSYMPSLPRPQHLTALLYQEQLATIAAWKKRQAASQKADNVAIQIQNATIDIAACHLSQAAAAEEPAAAPQEPLLKVERWCDLAIGIDEHRHYWAFTPPPGNGQKVRKESAVELKLPGKRWKALLELLATSADGHSAPVAELVQRLEYIAPATGDADKRARPGAVTAANTADMQIKAAAALKRLGQTVKDLSRELRDLVNGPKGSDEAALSCIATEPNVQARFVTRHLFLDEGRHTVFGQQ